MKDTDITLCVITKNAETTLERLLDNVGRYAKNIIFTLNDTTDSSLDVIKKWSTQDQKEKKYECFPRISTISVDKTFRHYDSLYFDDIPSSYLSLHGQLGPFGLHACFNFPGVCTGEKILGDFAGLRQLGFEYVETPWILLMDADDTMHDPESIPVVVERATEAEVDHVCSRYVYASDGRACMKDRLVRNLPHLRWKGEVHERIIGARKKVILEDGLVVTDRKDNLGEGTRIPMRNFKILWHHAGLRRWNIGSREWLFLLIEICSICNEISLGTFDVHENLMVLFFNKVIETSAFPEEKAFACSILGDSYYNRGDIEQAFTLYNKGLREFPSQYLAFKCQKISFDKQKFDESLKYFERAIDYKSFIQTLNSGTHLLPISTLLNINALRELGYWAKCLEGIFSFRSTYSELDESVKKFLDLSESHCRSML